MQSNTFLTIGNIFLTIGLLGYISNNELLVYICLTVALLFFTRQLVVNYKAKKNDSITVTK